MLANNKIKKALARQALKHLQSRIGGHIKAGGLRLHSVHDAFAEIVLPEPELSLSRRCYLLQTAPQKENRVQDALLDAGLDAYLPKEPVSVRLNGMTRRTTTRPMLPGYLFPIFDVHRDRWQSIPEMRHVIRLFMIEERPVPIPDSAIEHIRAREIEASMRGKARRAAPWIKLGAWVQFVEMPWIGLVGQVETLLEGRERIKVAIDLFGRQTPVEVSVNQVRAV